MNPNEFGLYMIILPHEARFCTIFGKIFKENEKSQPLWLTLNDLYFALNMDFQRKKPIFAYKTSYFQFGTLKYIDVFCKYNEHQYAALMTKAEIVKQIAGQTGLESKMVAGVVEALLEQIRAAQIGGENVYFRGFGSFVRRERAAKKARDISRNTTVLLPAHTVPAFKPSKAFVECLKK